MTTPPKKVKRLSPAQRQKLRHGIVMASTARLSRAALTISRESEIVGTLDDLLSTINLRACAAVAVLMGTDVSTAREFLLRNEDVELLVFELRRELTRGGLAPIEWQAPASTPTPARRSLVAQRRISA